MDHQMLKIAHVVRARQLQAINLICLVVAFITRRMPSTVQANLPTTDEILQRKYVREEMLHDLLNSGKCRELIRMSEKAFMTLCGILERDGGLRPTQRMSVKEHVARFLHVVGNDLRNRFASWIYRRSGSTTSRCLHRVLRAILSLESRYLQQPKGDIVPKEIQEKKRFYPFFKDCIGAIDGTHVRVRVPNKDAPRYRGRKGYLTINVLAACTFELKFTYVLNGWEGTASDSRIIKNALTREDKLVIPTCTLNPILLNCVVFYNNTNYNLFIGRYCLVDAGLPHTSSLMAPYRGVRYHLKEYSTRAPENSKELFNLRHASLRNAIERAFGVLKKRYPIIRSTAEPFYSCETQSDIFLACCILHNFLLEKDRDKDLEDEVIHEVLNGPDEGEHHNTRDVHEGSTGVDQLRNSIAREMWTNYLMYPNNEINMSK